MYRRYPGHHGNTGSWITGALWRRLVVVSTGAALALALATGCGERDPVGGDQGQVTKRDAGRPAGSEGGPCYGNGTCDKGLICASRLCVKLPTDGGPRERSVKDLRADKAKGHDGIVPDLIVLPDGSGSLAPCSKPGQSCKAKDPCAVVAVCGADKLCRPTLMQNCDDKLSCTTDSCKGAGLCANIPLAGSCALPVLSGGKTQITCFKVGAKKAGDPCMACNPTTHDGGVTNATSWSPITGGVCNDNNSCTKNDTCINGSCKGTYYGNLCADGFGCTTDLCDGKGGCLGNKLMSGWCMINGVCYKDGSKHPSGSCHACKSSTSSSSWTLLTNTCQIGGKCHAKGDKHSGGCAQCDPATSASKWTVSGSACLISDVCKKSGDKDTTGCQSCDPTKNKYGWTALSGLCLIGGKCYTKGTKHPGLCAECDATVNATGWTVKGNACLIGNVCKKAGDKDALSCAVCDPQKSKYSWTAPVGKCKINGACYSSGALHPGKCAVCLPGTNPNSWTVQSNAYCLIGNVCYKSGDKAPGGCSGCIPTKTRYAWSALSGLCQIDGACYSSGDKHPGGCGVCAPAKSSSSWTPAGSGCVINSSCHASGAKHPAGCGSCVPSKSKTAWTVSGSSCLIGAKCHASGAAEPGGCGVCKPASSQVAWTRAAGCLATHQWSRGFGGTSSDYGYAVGTDGSGNVYVAGYFYYSINLGGSTLTSKGSYDVFVASFTPGGNHRWSKSFGGSSSDYLYDLAVDGAGNVTITGGFYNSINFGGSTIYSKGSQDIFVASFTSGGKHRWSRGFGDISSDYGYGVDTDAAGNVAVTGYFYGSSSSSYPGVNFGGGTLKSNGSYDIFVASFTPAGLHRWSKNFGGSSSDYGYDVAADSAGNVHVTGYFYNSVNFGGGAITSKGGGDIFLASFSSAGLHRWSKGFGDLSSDYGYGVAVDLSGNVYITGYFYGSSSSSYQGINFGGGLLKSTSYGDVFLASFTSAGLHRWSKAWGGSSYDYSYGIAAGPKGNVYITGAAYSGIDFGGGTLNNNGSYDIYVASFSSAGVYRWSRSHGGTSSDYGRKIATDSQGNVLVTGYLYGSVDFGGGALTSKGSYDIFLLKLVQ